MNAFTWTDAPALVDWLARATWQSALLAAVVVVLQLAFGKWIAPRWRYAMWALVLARLAMPAQVGVPWRMASIDHPPVVQAASAPASASGVIVRVGVGPIPTEITESRIDSAIFAPPTKRSAWPIVVVIWLGIAGLVGAWIVMRHARFAAALRRDATLATDGMILEPLRGVCGDRRRWPRVLLSDRVTSPAVFGVIRPCVILPKSAVETMTSQQLRFVFLHELAHLRRFDPQAEFLAAMVCALHWFNPLVWFALRRLRVERELACDEAVLAQTQPEARSTYGHVLLALATAGPRPPVLSMASAAGQLKGRILRIARFNPRRRNVLAIALLAILTTAVFTDAQSENLPPVVENPSEPAAVTAPRLIDPTEASKNDAVREKLQRRLPEVRADGIPFEAVLDVFRDTADVPVFVRWKAVEAAGVKHDAPVKFSARNVTAARMLGALLDTASPAPGTLAYEIEAGAVVVTSAEDLALRMISTQAYDVRDIITVIPDFTAPSPSLAQRLASDEELKRLRTVVADVDIALAASKAGEGHPVTVQLKAHQDAVRQQIAKREAEIKSNAEQSTAEEGPTRRELVEQITSLVRDTVDPASWIENGGRIGQIREIGGQLIVTQSPSGHDGIARLLAVLRQNRSLQISVETRLILIDPTRVPEGALKGRLNEIEQGKANLDVKGDWFLVNDEVAKLLAEVKAIPDASLISAPRLTIFNGQRAFVQVVTQHPYVSDVRRGAADKKWEVVHDIAESGIHVNVAGAIAADRKYVTLTVNPKLSTLARMENVPTTLPADAPAGVQVQRPVIRAQELSTSVSIPDGGTVVLGGLADPREGKERRVLLLLVSPKVIEMRKEDADAQPRPLDR